MSRLKRLMFDTSRTLARWIAPGNRYSQYAFQDVLSALCAPSVRWLDLGCGHRLLPEWRGADEKEVVGRAGLVVGADLDLAAIKRHRSISHLVLADAMRLPFGNRHFDLVTANMVVEHLADPASQFEEISRVLKPGGAFLFHTPNAQGYIVRVARLLPQGIKTWLATILEGRATEDVYPTHYRANTVQDVARVALAAGLLVESCDFVSTSPAFGLVPPLAAVELAWIRWLQLPRRQHLRTNLVVVLRKASASL